ncbi:MAG: nucleoside deaminase [Dinoroseobacter sp.]|nr:nucleoside deaminase [Dinoroseobacter sp.]
MDDTTLRIGTKAAHAQAEKSLREGGIPVGAALMIDGVVVALGHNRRVQMGSNIRHGETDCIENAGHAFDLRQAVLFTTLSPCQMCTGAILLYQIPTVVILDDENTADFTSGIALLRSEGVDVRIAPHTPTVEMMRTFQTEPETRAIWMGDIGC